MCRLASSLSVLDFLHLGASLSLRSFARVGASFALLDYGQIGSTLSVRGLARIGSSLAIQHAIQFSNENTYVQFAEHFTGNPTGQLEIYVESYRTMSMSGKLTDGAAGILHGAWFSDDIVYTSDRRLKKNIRPLISKLNSMLPPLAKAADQRSEDGATWVLRELRPVVYEFKQGTEAKNAGGKVRYGFIADEMESTLPEVVRDAPQFQGIAYQDLIAVLTTAMQSLQRRLEKEEVRLDTQLQALEARLQARMDAHFRSLEDRLEAFFNRNRMDVEARPMRSTTVGLDNSTQVSD